MKFNSSEEEARGWRGEGGGNWRVYRRATGYFVGRAVPKRGNLIFPNVTPNDKTVPQRAAWIHAKPDSIIDRNRTANVLARGATTSSLEVQESSNSDRFSREENEDARKRLAPLFLSLPRERERRTKRETVTINCKLQEK